MLGRDDASVRRKRREAIVTAAAGFRHGEQIPTVAYTEDEVKTWGVMYEKLQEYCEKWVGCPGARALRRPGSHARSTSPCSPSSS